MSARRPSARRLTAALGSGLVAGATILGAGSCTVTGDPIEGAQTFRVTVTQIAVNKGPAQPLPAEDAPLEANIGDTEDIWSVEIQALDANAQPDPTFNGVVRLSVVPGAIVEVVDDSAPGESGGRNLLVKGGVATAQVTVTAVYGPARLWAEDLGYVPGPPDRPAACSNGVNDEKEGEAQDVLVDFPSDPGCAYANDDTETGGSFNAGVSRPVFYALPTLRQIQGLGATTPFPYEAVQANTSDPRRLIVTRVSKDGFYVTDLNDQGKGFNHLYAFNFSTPPGMQVCDRVTYLAGTLSEFFGFTELNFPSYRLDPLFVGQEELCEVPEPTVLTPELIKNDAQMEELESSLVRVEGFQVPSHFGPGLIVNNIPAEGASSCDLNGDGKVDFENEAEGGCSNACDADVECSEWTSFVARGNYKIHKDSAVIQVQTDGAQLFNPVNSPSLVLTAVSGSLRNFSGGNLNWTIEARCTDDVVCAGEGCTEAVKDSKHACVNLTRTIDDNDEGSN